MEVSKQIIEVLDAVGKKFGLAIDWTSQNIVPYIQQLGEKVVAYEFWTSVAWLVFAVILLILGGLAIYYDMTEYADGVLFVIGFIVGAVAIIVIGQQIMDMIACKTFPEKVMVEYVQSLMSNK